MRTEVTSIETLCPSAYEFCRRSTVLFNQALYHARQAFFEYRDHQTGPCYLNKYDLHKTLAQSEPYQSLGSAKAAGLVLYDVASAMTSFKALNRMHKLQGTFKPGLTRYINRDIPRVTRFEQRCVDKRKLAQGELWLTGIGFVCKTSVPYKQIREVRVVPLSHNKVRTEVVRRLPTYISTVTNRVWGQGSAGLDLGVDNFCTLTTDVDGVRPLIVKGRALVSALARTSQQTAQAKSSLPKGTYSSNYIKQLWSQYLKYKTALLNNAVAHIRDWCRKHGITTIIVGQNKGWKTECNLGKVNNQKFVMLPHSEFVTKLTTGLAKYGVTVTTVEESYTSKTSLFDNELPVKHTAYAGKRVHRGLFKTGTGRLVNADVNAAAQILRKRKPNAFCIPDGYGGMVFAPSPTVLCNPSTVDMVTGTPRTQTHGLCFTS